MYSWAVSLVPRSRNIKPGVCKNEILGAYDGLTRFFFVCLPMYADREGRLEDRPMRLKAEILPYDNCDIEAILSQLAHDKFIHRYEVDGESFIQVVNFTKHQNPHKNEADSELPLQPVDSKVLKKSPEKVVLSTDKPGTTPADSLLLVTDSLYKETSAKADALFLYWQTAMKHPRAKFIGKRKRNAINALKQYSVDDLKQAVDGCKLTPFNMGENDSGQIFDDLELITRNESNIERFMQNAEAPPERKQNETNRKQSAVDRVRQATGTDLRTELGTG